MLRIVLTQQRNGETNLSARHIPADGHPQMTATYRTLADALDQVDWMLCRNAYAGRLPAECAISSTVILQNDPHETAMNRYYDVDSEN